MKQLTQDQAIGIHDSGVWKDWTNTELVRFQLYQERLFVPFGTLHEAVERVLGRPVWSHEFADPERLQNEFENYFARPSCLAEFFALLPFRILQEYAIED